MYNFSIQKLFSTTNPDKNKIISLVDEEKAKNIIRFVFLSVFLLQIFPYLLFDKQQKGKGEDIFLMELWIPVETRKEF